MDGRTRAARQLREQRDLFLKNSGRKPTAALIAMAERAAWFTYHLSKLDEQLAEGEELSETEVKQYASFSESLMTLLVHLDPGLSEFYEINQASLEEAV